MSGKEAEIKKSTVDYCERDYHNHHYWERVGVFAFKFILYRCTQCEKCKLERIKFVGEDGCLEYKDREEALKK
jgi:hypothetical protein